MFQGHWAGLTGGDWLRFAQSAWRGRGRRGEGQGEAARPRRKLGSFCAFAPRPASPRPRPARPRREIGFVPHFKLHTSNLKLLLNWVHCFCPENPDRHVPRANYTRCRCPRTVFFGAPAQNTRIPEHQNTTHARNGILSFSRKNAISHNEQGIPPSHPAWRANWVCSYRRPAQVEATGPRPFRIRNPQSVIEELALFRTVAPLPPLTSNIELHTSNLLYASLYLCSVLHES